ncbi:MAG: DUF2121 domain-containing protein [Methanomicrobiaceae archaeon]|nr:DUF2121 domain-containing protein [Methanomicrobiaceae archaeon]
MSLVIAFVGKNGAVMAGDRRSVFFLGNDASVERLERELYSGRIVADEDLHRRSDAIGIQLFVYDDRCKVALRNGVLVGEVTSSEGGKVRKRRVYAAAGRYAIAEFEGGEGTVTQQGEGSAFVVFGSEIAKKITNAVIQEHWKSGGLAQAVAVIRRAMEKAGRETASVSRECDLLQTTERADIDALLAEDLG